MAIIIPPGCFAHYLSSIPTPFGSCLSHCKYANGSPVAHLFESPEVFFGYYKRHLFEGGGFGSVVATIFVFDDSRINCFFRSSQKV